MPSANRPAVPSKNFLMKRFSNLVAVYSWTICAYVPASDPKPTREIPASPVPKWQHSRKLVGPAISSPGFLGEAGLGSEQRQQSSPIHSPALADAVLLSP